MIVSKASLGRTKISVTLCIALLSPLTAMAADTSEATRLRSGGPEPAGAAPLSPGGMPGIGSNALGRPATAEGPTPKPSDQAPGPLGGARSPSTSAATGAGGGFTLQICNKSSEVAAAAVTHREGAGWLIEGWFRVEPGQCRNTGVYQHGWVYYYADGANGGGWGAGLVNLCVRYPGPFQRSDDGTSYTCGAEERLRGFSGRFIETNVGTHTWSLTE